MKEVVGQIPQGVPVDFQINWRSSLFNLFLSKI
jgi:hypothetical protein